MPSPTLQVDTSGLVLQPKTLEVLRYSEWHRIPQTQPGGWETDQALDPGAVLYLRVNVSPRHVLAITPFDRNLDGTGSRCARVIITEDSIGQYDALTSSATTTQPAYTKAPLDADPKARDLQAPGVALFAIWALLLLWLLFWKGGRSAGP